MEECGVGPSRENKIIEDPPSMGKNNKHSLTPDDELMTPKVLGSMLQR
jgi:hypothetical protein